MEISPTLMDRQDQHNKNGNTTKNNYRVSEIPIKIPPQFFTELERTVFNFILEEQKSKIAKTTLGIKGTSGGITIPDFKLYYGAIVMKTA